MDGQSLTPDNIKLQQLQDTGFKVLKFSDSNFKQWQQIIGKDINSKIEHKAVSPGEIEG